MRTNTFLLFLLFVRLLNAHDETPTAYGYYLSGIKQVNKLIVFSGAGSMDNDNQDHGQTPAWYWDFDSQGSFVADKVTSSTITTYTFILPGTYTVGLRYKDNDGTLSTVYTFEIEIVELLRYYYLKDHLGNIRMTVDENGEIAGYDDYYPFGMMMDNRRGNTANPDDKYKYSGKEYDTETGYSYFGARSYDARIGRWLSVDPLMDKYPGWSPYNYVMNNPLALVDPDGMRVELYIAPTGSNADKGFSELKSESSLTLNMDQRGKITGINEVGPLTQADTKLLEIMNDAYVEVNIKISNTDLITTLDGLENTSIGAGLFDGNYCSPNGIITTSQWVTFAGMELVAETGAGSIGQTLLHEIFESHFASAVVGPYTVETYTFAHNAAMQILHLPEIRSIYVNHKFVGVKNLDTGKVAMLK